MLYASVSLTVSVYVTYAYVYEKCIVWTKKPGRVRGCVTTVECHVCERVQACVYVCAYGATVTRHDHNKRVYMLAYTHIRVLHANEIMPGNRMKLGPCLPTV